MSFVTIHPSKLVKKQYIFKIKAYSRAFTSLLILQILGTLFSFGGVSSFSSGSSTGLSIDGHSFSATLVIAFTLLWAFLTAILITTKAYRYDDFAFVTNRMTNHFSNILFLLTTSVIGGVSAMFCGFLIKDILYYVADSQLVIAGNFSFFEWLTGLAATVLYVLLLNAFGYLIGTVVQLHSTFVFLVPALLIGAAFLGAGSGATADVTRFYFNEPFFPLFLAKVIVTAVLFFGLAMLISDRMEVRK